MTSPYLIQEIEMFTGIRPYPSQRFPPQLNTQPSINAAAINSSNQVLAVSSSLAGISSGKSFCSLVTLTFFSISNNNLKQFYSMQIDRLRIKEVP